MLTTAGQLLNPKQLNVHGQAGLDRLPLSSQASHLFSKLAHETRAFVSGEMTYKIEGCVLNPSPNEGMLPLAIEPLSRAWLVVRGHRSHPDSPSKLL